MIYDDIKPAISLVKLAHSLVQAKVKHGDVVIDATVGNGHDTLFLLNLVAPTGVVYGFDIQQAAIDSTQNRLHTHSAAHSLNLIHASHATMLDHIATYHQEAVNAIMFNLGYLPGSDKSVITHAESTLVALSMACRLLAVGGIITILAYPGHAGGEVETTAINTWCLGLDRTQFNSMFYDNPSANSSAPKLFSVTKIR